MTLEILQLLWYAVVAVSVIFYVVLDGFDLGVGSLQLFVKNDHDRRIFLNSIGPFWDGNEVWLIVIGGGLFVGFPDVYAAVFSGFYVMFMIYLAGIIFRAVAIEFRSKYYHPIWRSAWDVVFCVSSLAITFGAGLLLGNLVKGVPIDAARDIYASFGSLFSPYALMMGVMAVFLFAMHGNHFLLMKTEGALQKKLDGWIITLVALFCVSFIVMTLWTWKAYPHMTSHFHAMPIFWLVPLLMLAFLVASVIFAKRKAYGLGFFFSMLTITFLFLLFIIGTFPNMVVSSIDPAHSLTLYNASASTTTLEVALTIAVIGVPLVLLYGYVLYSVFRGKTQIHEHSY